MHACPPLLVEHTAVFLWALSQQGCLPFAALHCWALGRQLLSQLSVSMGSLCLATCRLGLVRLSFYSQTTCLCPASCLEPFP